MTTHGIPDPEPDAEDAPIPSESRAEDAAVGGAGAEASAGTNARESTADAASPGAWTRIGSGARASASALRARASTPRGGIAAVLLAAVVLLATIIAVAFAGGGPATEVSGSDALEPGFDVDNLAPPGSAAGTLAEAEAAARAPSTGLWKTGESLPNDSMETCAVVAGDRILVAAGYSVREGFGRDRGGRLVWGHHAENLDGVVLYDPAAGTILETDAATPFAGPTHCVALDEGVYAFTAHPSGRSVHFLDPAQGTWAHLGILEHAGTMNSATALGEEGILLSTRVQSDWLEFHYFSASHELVEALPPIRIGTGSAAVGTLEGIPYVVGEKGIYFLDSDATWRRGPAPPEGCQDATAASERLFAFGDARVCRYDLFRNIWRDLGPPAAWGAFPTVVQDGSVVHFIGGYGSGLVMSVDLDKL